MPIFSDVDENEYAEDTQQREEDERQEDADLSSFPAPLHSTVLPWLKKKLRAPHLGLFTEQVLQEFLIGHYNLDQPVEEMDGREQEQLLNDVRRLMQIERSVASKTRSIKSDESVPPTDAEGNTRAGSTSRIPPSRADQQQAINLLTLQEQEATKAVSLYWSALLMNLPEIKRWRTRVLQGKRLTASQADAFISSPATRFLTVEQWQKHAVSALDPAARILNWELDYIDEEELLPERRAQAHVFSTADSQGYFNSYRATLELREPHRTELVLELLAGEDALLWIPFLALPDASDPSDETYPRMFPGSVADELRLLGEGLSRGLPFQPWQVAWLILTDEVPQILPVRVTSLMPSLKAAQKADMTPEHAFRARLAAGLPPDGYIKIEAFPWVSAKTVQCYYSHYQKPMITRKPTIVRRTTDQPAVERPVAEPIKQHLPAMHLLQAIQGMARQQQQGTSMTWKDLRRNQLVHNQLVKDQSNNQNQNDRRDYSSFVKGCKSAWTMLNLPWDLKQMIKKATETPNNRDKSNELRRGPN